MEGKGNRGFAALIAGEGGREPTTRLPPRTGILSGRENRLAEMASGQAKTRVHEAVDPARCRIWDGHNRDYQALDETACADLIESMKSQGRQEMPAIVRRVRNDPDIDFEVVCGARRHWTVTWLRTHDYPDFRFLVEPRELSDEEAFRIADLENRSRKDLSDYERAQDYARAIERYYEGSQQRMADRLNVTKSWLSRYLELAKLPESVVKAFGSAHVIGISHAARLAPVLRAPAMRRNLEAAAWELGAEQGVREGQGKAALTPALVMARLMPSPSKPQGRVRRAVIKGEDGRVLLRAEMNAVGAITFTVAPAARRQTEIILEAVARALHELSGEIVTTR